MGQSRVSRARIGVAVSSFALAAFVLARPARAHFTLQAPASWDNQDSVGSPQKSAPCGQADPGMAAVATGQVTAFHAGETITVTIDEKVFHPGHYRAVLAVKDRSELPADPPVTAGTTACGSTPIDPSPAFPVLVDGALKHTAQFSGPQSFQVTLPSDVTCSKCTLQIVEFMSDHGLNNPGGCFYHHCADISIQSQGGAGGATGAQGGASAHAGAMAQGGAMAQAGASAQGGVAQGGTQSSGGSSAGSAGQSSSMGGAPQGGATGLGGVFTGMGGAVTSGGVIGLAGASSAGQPSDAGCSCRLISPSATPRAALVSLLIAGLLAVRRARRS